MARSTNPNDVQDRFQFYINELGPILAEKANHNRRSLTEEIRARLRETLRNEGIDVDTLLKDWQRESAPLLVLAGTWREAQAWAHCNGYQDWQFVRGLVCLQGMANRDYVITGRVPRTRRR